MCNFFGGDLLFSQFQDVLLRRRCSLSGHIRLRPKWDPEQSTATLGLQPAGSGRCLITGVWCILTAAEWDTGWTAADAGTTGSLKGEGSKWLAWEQWPKERSLLDFWAVCYFSASLPYTQLQMQSDYGMFKQAMDEERYRSERLEEQINDLTELHQHEVTNIKQVKLIEKQAVAAVTPVSALGSIVKVFIWLCTVIDSLTCEDALTGGHWWTKP